MRWSIPIVLLFVCVGLLRAQDAPAPATAPTAAESGGIVDVTDADAVERAMGRDVIVQGVVERAEWSRSGKVMNIEFNGAPPNGLLAVVFEQKRAQFDEAFAGDLSKALTGARVRLKGTIKPYGGHVESMKGRPQIIIEGGHQITIVEKAPATQPG